MKNDNIKILGYARFLRSLLRYFDDDYFKDYESTLNLTYNLYAAVIKTYQERDTSGKEIKRVCKFAFSKIVKNAEVKPFKTEAHLHCAMKKLLDYISVYDIDCFESNALLTLQRLMAALEMRFYKAFGMEIDDYRVKVYDCGDCLVPNEPDIYV